MLVRNRTAFNRGLLLMGSFLVVLVLIFVPMGIWGTRNDRPMNFLEYSDNLFNRLSKGSSYFIPDVREQVQPLLGTPFQAEVQPARPGTGPAMVAVLQAAGAQASLAPDGSLTVQGDLGEVLMHATQDSDAMFHNDGPAVQARYPGLQPRDVMRAWWSFQEPLIRDLQRQTLYNAANVVNTVQRRAVEPGFNFYSIQAERIGDRAFLVFVLLAFYVLYTVWYGFAIFELFEGLGLTMKKAKVKQEV